ncbi:hypothetical protein GW17_00021991 [Ensete ventricosum]|nr:hypothetical protein GW17_00021991 [Ensete ventricosum]RZS23158.1 hypothetical protein BHM03_00056026 [Ensete ventricosum]
MTTMVYSIVKPFGFVQLFFLLGVRSVALATLLENLVWENKELEERLQIAMEDRKVIEMILKEIEEEHEKAVTRIDLLENEVTFFP